jgi:hypothetical protein
MVEIIVYDCIYMCVIFQFKTGVKLKRGWVEPLLQSYFRRLGKNVENRSIVFLAARYKPPKIGPNNFRRLLNFGGLTEKLQKIANNDHRKLG